MEIVKRIIREIGFYISIILALVAAFAIMAAFAPEKPGHPPGATYRPRGDR